MTVNNESLAIGCIAINYRKLAKLNRVFNNAFLPNKDRSHTIEFLLNFTYF